MRIAKSRYSLPANSLYDAHFFRLKQREVRLREITTKQGTNVKEFVALVKENQETLNALKSCVNAQTVALLVDAVSVRRFAVILLFEPHPSIS
jgi:hypothetical protein